MTASDPASLAQLVERWTNPEFPREGSALTIGDATQSLKLLPSESIPLTLTSPPYNIGMSFEEKLSVDEYIAWASEWLGELARVTKPNGSVWVNLGFCEVPGTGKAVPISYLLWNQMPMYLLQEVVWYFRAGVACRKLLSPRNEKLLWFVKDPKSYQFDLDAIRSNDVRYPTQSRNGKLRCNPLGRNPSDVWEIPRVTGGKGRSASERVNHPTQMPLELASRVIEACSSPGDIVLDPFLGSGTTGVAALRLARKFVGIERNRTYAKLASSRLRTGV